MTNPTPLGFALIGLALAEPRSGYALRKVFEATPLGRYSSSPGSIYPVLKKLENAKLTETRDGLVHVTKKGRRAFMDWLNAPVTAESVERGIDIVLLRFAFIDGRDNPAAAKRFLESFQAAVEEQVRRIRRYVAEADADALSPTGCLALEHGLACAEAQIRWAAKARRQFSARVRQGELES